jgi:hypothetical protein
VRGLGQVGSGWVSSGPGTAAWLCAVRELALASGVWRLAWRRRWVRAAGWDQLELEWLRLADLQPGSSDIQHSGSSIQHPASSIQALGGGHSLPGCLGARQCSVEQQQQSSGKRGLARVAE